MEVRSESGIMSGREPFNVGLQKNLVTSQPQMAMRVAYTSDGTTVYQPMPVSPPYQGGGAGGGGGGGVPVTPPYQGGGAGGGGGGGVAAATSAGGEASAQSIPTHGININMGEPMKRKRGRPRKYGPDGTMALALMPVAPGSGGFPSAPAALQNPTSPSTAAALKKVRGRPPGSGRKQQMDALGSGGIGFTPHVITVKAGEDVSSKIMSFSQHGPRAICILSANGAISNVTLRQAATSGGTVTYEGRFEILSLSGSFLPSDNDGQRSRTGGLSVSLAGPDGRVLGGGVAGILTAASPVQVVVGSFIAYGRKEMKATTNPLDPASAPGKLAAAPMRAGSPPSRGTMSESSGGAGSPINHSTSASNHNNQRPINLTTTASNHNNQQGLSNMPWK